MNATDIVGATWEADTYCVPCTQERFAGITFGGPERGNDDEYADSEGNPVRPIFASEVHQGDSPDYCGSCGTILAPYECSICGDEHGESAHGEPLVQRDQYARSTTDAVAVYLSDAYAILAGPNGDQILRNGLAHYGRLERLDHGWPEDGERGWRNLTDDERDEYAPEYLDDIDSILSDAGFHPVTNSDGGAWCIYAAVPERVQASS